jgi:hypothetical protein
MNHNHRAVHEASHAIVGTALGIRAVNDKSSRVCISIAPTNWTLVDNKCVKVPSETVSGYVNWGVTINRAKSEDHLAALLAGGIGQRRVSNTNINIMLHCMGGDLNLVIRVLYPEYWLAANFSANREAMSKDRLAVNNIVWAGAALAMVEKNEDAIPLIPTAHLLVVQTEQFKTLAHAADTARAILNKHWAAVNALSNRLLKDSWMNRRELDAFLLEHGVTQKELAANFVKKDLSEIAEPAASEAAESFASEATA